MASIQNREKKVKISYLDASTEPFSSHAIKAYKAPKKPASTLKKAETESSSSEDDDSMYSSSAEDIEFDEKALRKFLAEKIEQAPAAKVIVSDALMREAISEINSRKSQNLPFLKPSAKSAVCNFSAKAIKDEDEKITKTLKSFPPKKHTGNTSRNPTSPISSVSMGSGDAQGSKNGGSKAHLSSSNPITSAQHLSTAETENISRAEATPNGCPLETVIQFLQAVISKDYKKALIWAKEVERDEPHNEIIQEYKSVLQKVVQKEEYAEASDSELDDACSNGAGDFTDEFTTESETESDSNEETGKKTSSLESSPSSSETDENAEDNSQNGNLESRSSEEDIEGLRNANLESKKRDEAHETNANDKTHYQTKQEHLSEGCIDDNSTVEDQEDEGEKTL